MVIRRTNLIIIVIVGCLMIGEVWNFQPGNIYKYSYSTTLTIDQPGRYNVSKITSHEKQNGGLRLNAVVEISALWERNGDYMMKLAVINGRISGGSGGVGQTLSNLSKHPIYFSRILGSHMVVYRLLDDSLEAVNIKQGIINLLVYQLQPGTQREVDVVGECDVSYSKVGHLIRKTKSNCVSRLLTGQFTNPHKLLSLSTVSHYAATYDVDDMMVLKHALAEEVHVTRAPVDRRIGSLIAQKQELTLLGKSSGEVIPGSELNDVVNAIRQRLANGNNGLLEGLLSSEMEKAHCQAFPKKKASHVVAQYRDDLYKDNMALPRAAHAFLHVVQALRSTDKKTILEILKDEENFYLINELIDAAVAAQTHEAQNALLEFLSFDDEYEQELLERYLFAMAYSTHPNKADILRLKGLITKGIPNKTVRTSTFLALGAVLHTFSKNVNRYTIEVLTEAQNWLLSELNACADGECRAMHLGALRNAALDGTLPTILYYAEHAEKEAVNLAAIDALSRFDRDILDHEAQTILLRILYQREQQQPLAVRVRAIEQLLSTKLAPDDLHDVVVAARNLPSNESNAYVIRRIIDRLKNDDYYSNLMKMVSENKQVYNYNTLATLGNSSAMTNRFIDSHDVTSTYGLFIEKTPSGLLRKSITDVVARTRDNIELPLVSVGIYADGLDSIASYFGGTDDKSDSKKEPSAGLTLSLLGVSLRPIKFFSTHGEMMSALWNAPSSPVSALQGNLLLHDHSQLLALGNGLTVDIQLRSCLSLDLSGAVSVSLWNRASSSIVQNSGAFVLKGAVSVYSESFSAGVNYTAEVMGEIDFSSEVDFSGTPVTMCAQMTLPEYEYKLSVNRETTVRGEKIQYQRSTNSRRAGHGQSFILDPANTIHCRLMDAKDSV